VFDIDIEHCPQCGGKLKIIAAIEESAVIERILTHLGLSAQPPPRNAGAARRSLSGGLIRKPGLVLAEPMDGLGLHACRRADFGEIGRSEGQDSGVNSGVCVNCHVVDASPGERYRADW